MNIAVIGSGISGLTTAYLLSKKHSVTLYEASDNLGLGSNGVQVSGLQNELNIDIPPRVFNRAHYKKMLEFFDLTGVEAYEIKQQPTFFNEKQTPYLSFNTLNIGSISASFPSIKANCLSWVATHGVELIKWQRFVCSQAPRNLCHSMDLKTSLDELGFSKSFRESFLFPVWSLMCTCPFSMLEQFPAHVMYELFKNFTTSAPTLRVKGGTKTIESKLAKVIDNIKLSSPVKSLREEGIKLLVTSSNEDTCAYDKVVVATEPQNALKLLDKNLYPEIHELLKSVPTHKTNMILHTDQSLMPKSNWSVVNLQYYKKQRRSSAILWMNPIEPGHLGRPVFQSWDPVVEPSLSMVICQRSFNRSLTTPASTKSMKVLREKMKQHQTGNIYFSGTYLYEGVALLENGVKSAYYIESLLN